MVHFALGLDGRRRHGTDGRRDDEQRALEQRGGPRARERRGRQRGREEAQRRAEVGGRGAPVAGA
jgi:hypothetical protein